MPTELTARDLMTTELLTFTPDQPIDEAIDQLLQRRVSGAPVVEDGTLVGLLSEKDCLRLVAQLAAYQMPVGGAVRDFMTVHVTTVAHDADLLTVAGMFLDLGFRRFPVIDASGGLVGQVSRRDVLRGIQQLRTVRPQYPDYRAPRER